MNKAVQHEAEKLIEEHDGTASSVVEEAIRSAQRHRNARLASYLLKVAKEIERREA